MESVVMVEFVSSVATTENQPHNHSENQQFDDGRRKGKTPLKHSVLKGFPSFATKFKFGSKQSRKGIISRHLGRSIVTFSLLFWHQITITR